MKQGSFLPDPIGKVLIAPDYDHHQADLIVLGSLSRIWPEQVLLVPTRASRYS